MKRILALATMLLGAIAGAQASPWPSNCIQAISVGQTVNGQLAATDCSWAYNSAPSQRYYTDVYSFTGTAGQQVAIALSSTNVDTLVELYNVNEVATNAIVLDDNGGGGTNSRIPPGSGYFTLPATGTYYIWAETAVPDRSGTYTLTLSAPGTVPGPGPTPTVSQVTVTEFYHPGFNHYFITAYPEEAASLAAGNLPPWTPTGQTFKVWGGPDAGLTNVCRFFSATFAPRSSHFYSNNPVECPSLGTKGVWTLEKADAFYMMPSATGSCPTGTMPLYRLYNNGLSGAPNHRYTIHASVRTQMIAQGWIPEGNGPDGVFACVPFVNTPPPPPPNASAFQTEVTGYVNTILGLVSGDIVDVDQLGIVLGAAIEALLDPTITCPRVTTNPPLAGLTAFPPTLTINVDFGSGCSVQTVQKVTGATISGTIVITINNLVVTDTGLTGTVAATFNAIKVNGVLVANGTAQGNASLTINPVTEALSGPINLTVTNFQLPSGLGATGTVAINLNTAGTTTVSTDLVTSPNNLALKLNASIVPAGDGSVLVNTTSLSTVGAYTVQAVNLKIDIDVCAGAIGGTLSFSKGGQTGTFTFNSSCGYTYSGP